MKMTLTRSLKRPRTKINVNSDVNISQEKKIVLCSRADYSRSTNMIYNCVQSALPLSTVVRFS